MLNLQAVYRTPEDHSRLPEQESNKPRADNGHVDGKRNMNKNKSMDLWVQKKANGMDLADVDVAGDLHERVEEALREAWAAGYSLAEHHLGGA